MRVGIGLIRRKLGVRQLWVLNQLVDGVLISPRWVVITRINAWFLLLASQLCLGCLPLCQIYNLVYHPLPPAKWLNSPEGSTFYVIPLSPPFSAVVHTFAFNRRWWVRTSLQPLLFSEGFFALFFFKLGSLSLTWIAIQIGTVLLYVVGMNAAGLKSSLWLR